MDDEEIGDRRSGKSVLLTYQDKYCGDEDEDECGL